jgi:hypothetical protein
MLAKPRAFAKKIAENKTRILVTSLAVTTAVVVIQHNGIKSLNAFIDEHGLTDLYYTMDEI